MIREERKSVMLVSDWHRRAYERCKQQAKEENRSLNEIVSERYGVCALYTFIFENQSVEFFQSMEKLMSSEQWTLKISTENIIHHRIERNSSSKRES